VEQFTFDVIEEFASEEEAFLAETWWIEFLRSNVRGFGFNLDSGGVGGRKRSAETKRVLSEKSKANNVRYWLGKHHSSETRAKIGAASKGRTWTLEQREKMLAAREGRHVSPETREKIASSLRGKKRPPTTEEVKAKMSASHKANPLPTSMVSDRARRGWKTRRENEAARKRDRSRH
jgi:hypothetical protein